jgi:hypothetical protein
MFHASSQLPRSQTCRVFFFFCCFPPVTVRRSSTGESSLSNRAYLPFLILRTSRLEGVGTIAVKGALRKLLTRNRERLLRFLSRVRLLSRWSRLWRIDLIPLSFVRSRIRVALDSDSDELLESELLLELELELLLLELLSGEGDRCL